MNHNQYIDMLLEAETIKWIKPDIQKELGEYFENTYTKKFLKKHGIEFKDKKSLEAVLIAGKLVPMTRERLSSNSDNLTLSDSDFEHELKDPEYKKSFESMEKKLESGSITLPAPIILNINGLYYGYAGNRRMNLAFRHKLPLKVWLVDMKENI